MWDLGDRNESASGRAEGRTDGHERHAPCDDRLALPVKVPLLALLLQLEAREACGEIVRVGRSDECLKLILGDMIFGKGLEEYETHRLAHEILALDAHELRIGRPVEDAWSLDEVRIAEVKFGGRKNM